MNKSRSIAILLAVLMLTACCAQATAPAGTDSGALTYPFDGQKEPAPENPAKAPDAPAEAKAAQATETPEAPAQTAAPEPEATPSITPKPTLAPEGPYAVLIASLREAAAQGCIAMPRALEGWLVSRVQQTDTGLNVALPMFADTKTGSLPAYNGEAPSLYLAEVAKLLADEIMLLPMDADAGRIEVPSSKEADPSLVKVLIALGEDMEMWLDARLNAGRVYPAMTRMLLDHGAMDITYWPNVYFEKSNQAPVYGRDEGHRPLKRDDVGPSVRAAQEALIEQGYLVADHSTGTFTPQMEDAVRKFEAASGFPEDGMLSPEEQYKLFRETPPYTMPGVLAEAAGRQEAVDQWWEWFVYMLYSVEWTGSTATICYKDFAPLEEALFINALSMVGMEDYDMAWLDDDLLYMLNLANQEEELDLKTAKVSLTLDALRGVGGITAMTKGNQDALWEAFDAFYMPLYGAGDMVRMMGESGITFTQLYGEALGEE